MRRNASSSNGDDAGGDPFLKLASEFVPFARFGTYFKRPAELAELTIKLGDGNLDALLPLLRLSDCPKATESVRMAWEKITAAGIEKFAKQIRQEGFWPTFAVSAIRASPASMTPLVKVCGTLGGRAVKDRLKQARRTGRGMRANAISEPMLLWWLPVGLWLCDDQAGSEIFSGLVGPVNAEAYGRRRRALKLYRREHPPITAQPRRAARSLAAEVLTVGGDFRRLWRLLNIAAST